MSDTLGTKKQIVEEALCELKKHRQTTGNFFASVSEPLRIAHGEITKKNLWKILLIDIQSRGGPKLEATDIQKTKR